MKRLFWVMVLFPLALASPAQVMVGDTEVDTATVIAGLDVPWEVLYGPDDHLWVTERFGRVSRVDPASGEQQVLLDLSASIYQGGEAGLLGMALHPDFSSQPHVFLAYTYKVGDDILKRISRFTYDGAVLSGEFILMDDLPAKNNHNGCRLVITPDWKLLVTNGDASSMNSSQNMGTLAGKVLRINLDGSVPADNPWPGSPIYTLGHRNPQGLFLADNGILYSSEHGPDADDEVNIIEPGRNYGWAEVWGFCDEPDEITFCEENDVVEPIAAWTPTIAPAGLIRYDHPAIPDWSGKLLLATLKNKRIYALELDPDGTAVLSQTQHFNNFWGRLRDVCAGPDGSVYLATNGPDWNNSQPFTHRIVRIWNPEFVISSADKRTGESSFAMWPNPATGRIYVRAGDGQAGQTVRLVSPVGQTVREVRAAGHTTVIDVSGLPGGVYLLIGGTDPGRVVRKVVLE